MEGNAALTKYWKSKELNKYWKLKELNEGVTVKISSVEGIMRNDAAQIKSERRRRRKAFVFVNVKFFNDETGTSSCWAVAFCNMTSSPSLGGSE
jgi:hypothetical protein